MSRKDEPVFSGVLKYFPKTVRAVARLSKKGNDKHNPGEPLHWAREKSTDDADALARHLIDHGENPLGIDPDSGEIHAVSVAWRAWAVCEKALEALEAAPAVAPPPPANVPHSPEFFAQMRTCRDAYIRLAEAFATVLPRDEIRTILDFGCGTGHQTAALARLGYLMTGMDPLAHESQVEPGFVFHQIDPIEMRSAVAFDAVICTEVAEHVYESRANDLVRSVCNAARKRVIWSAARPGQEWEGHVNLQEPRYWELKFRENGFRVRVAASYDLRQEMHARSAQHCGAADNFFVFDRVKAGT